MKDKKKNGIGLRYALNGLKEAFVREKNFRIHVSIAILVIITSAIFRLNQLEWVIILTFIHFVLIAELVNSVIERLIDYIKPELHPNAKIIKDMAAAIVLIAAITSVIVGLIIFIPKVISFF